MASDSELACVYAALILADDGVTITEEKLQSIIDASGAEVEAYWPSLFARALDGVDIKDLVSKVGSGAGSAPAAGGAAPAAASGEAAPAEAKKEEKKKEESESEDDDMGFGLFD